MSKNCLQDARVHYAVLKKQPHTSTTLPTQQQHRGGPATHPTPTTNPSTNKESRRPWGRVQPHNPIACLHLKPPSHALSRPPAGSRTHTRPDDEAPIR